MAEKAQRHGFPQFTALPAEIRRLIWNLCIPERLVAADKLHMDFLPTAQQQCRAWKTPIQPNARPVVKAVCKEASDAVEAGGLARGYTQDADADSHIWIQPKRDKLQLFWTRYCLFMDDHRSDYPHAMFAYESDDVNMPVSIMGEPLATFPPGKGQNGSTIVEWPTVETIKNVRDGGNAAAADLVVCLQEAADVDMVLDVVNLHISDRKAAESGLFGLLGDAPVQTVAYDDTERMLKFQALFQTTRSLSSDDELDDAAAAELVYILSPIFQSDVILWIEIVEWVLMAQMWFHDLLDGHFQSQTAGSVWEPAIDMASDDVVEISMQQHRFQPDHPWVRRATEKMLRIHPTVMFRHCRVSCRATLDRNGLSRTTI